MSLSIENVNHTYPSVSGEKKPVLQGISFSLTEGEQLLLRGISGSGKTTLINILAGLLTPTTGNVVLNDQNLYALDEAPRDEFRRTKIGYVFQTHHLLPILNAWENVAMPLAFAGISPKIRQEKAHALLENVGLGSFAKHRPHQLSNGQRQRVAIARAMVNNPQLILADEPTASLDADTAVEVMEMLQEKCRQNQITLILASHDPFLETRFQRIADLQYGKWIEGANTHA